MQKSLTSWFFSKIRPLLDFAFYQVSKPRMAPLVFVPASVAAFTAWYFSDSTAITITVLTVAVATIAAPLCTKEWMLYSLGPPETESGIIFLGFYEISGSEDEISRSSSSKLLETHFMQTLDKDLQDHAVNSKTRLENTEVNVEVIDNRAPRGFFETQGYEGLRETAQRFSTGCLAVVWGLVDNNGTLRHFETTIDPNRFYGEHLFKKQLNSLYRAVDADLPSEIVVVFLARTLASIFGYGYCDYLIQSGKLRESLAIAASSRRLLERALVEFQEETGEGGKASVQYYRRLFLPGVLAQEATCLWFDKRTNQALQKMFEALRVDPLYPLGEKERFKDFFNHSYAYELTKLWDEIHQINGGGEVDQRMLARRYKESALAELQTTANIKRFVSWISESLHAGDELTDEIENWFSELSSLHTQDPFVYIYWGEALKYRAGIKYGEQSGYPFVEALDETIEKWETAYSLDSSLTVVAARLAWAYQYSVVVAETWCSMPNTEVYRRLECGRKWHEKAEAFYDEFPTERPERDEP